MQRELDNCLLEYSKYNKIYKECEGIYRIAARKFGLSDCAMAILYALYEHDAVSTQKGLCDRLLQSKQSIHSALKKLEDDGYVELKFEENNKKNKIIYLTSLGEKLAKETVGKVMDAEEKSFLYLPEEERELFLTLYKKYVDILKVEMTNIFIEGEL